MKKILIIAISIVLIIGLGAGGVFIYKTFTPEYALAMTIEDVKTFGMDGLKDHLTSDAFEKIEAVKNQTDKSGVFDVLTSITQDSAVGLLKSKMSEVDWTVEDILKGKKRADVVIGFNYKDSVIGTVDIKMIFENYKWKIDGISVPDFEQLSLW